MSRISRPTRASIIEPVGGHGGMNHYDFNLCKGLSSAGVDVALFTSDATQRPVNAPFEFLPVYREIFGTAPKWRRALRFLRGTVLALSASIQKRRKIVHFHFFSVGPLEAFNILISRLALRKVVITAHDVEAFVSHLDTPGLPRFTYGLAHAVIAHNQISREALVERIGVAPARVHVIPAGNHLDSLPKVPTQKEARFRLSLPEQGPILLFFGQIKQVKGLDLLLDSMPAVLSKHPDVTLVIAGRPWKMEFQEYQDQIDKLNISTNCITHIRYISDNDLPLYYQACDLVTLPYRKIYQSDVILMAMSYGVPVVTSDIPGMIEIIEHNHTGFLFRSGDDKDLARVITEALEQPDSLQTVVEQARQLMVDRFGWDRIGHALASLYRTL